MIENIIEFSDPQPLRGDPGGPGAWWSWGVYAVINTPVDAIPDLSENQVIVFTDWMGRSPREIEDQITYPLSVNLQGLAGVKSVRSLERVQFLDDQHHLRGQRRFLFRPAAGAGAADAGQHVPAAGRGALHGPRRHGPGADLLVHGGRARATTWAGCGRSRTGTSATNSTRCPAWPRWPRSAATRSNTRSTSIPTSSRSYGVTLGELYAAVARSNSSVGGRVIHKGNAEYLIRGVGWIRSIADIEQIVVKSDPAKGTPICVSNLATVGLGTQFRRSVLEKDGNEAVGGVVMMRLRRESAGRHPAHQGEDRRSCSRACRAGVRIVPFYDRTRLIEGRHPHPGRNPHARDDHRLAGDLLILMHFRSAVLICLTLPLAVLVSFILMRLFGIASNIMSLSGIAISIGILVDQAIVMVENATHHLTAHFGQQRVTGDTRELVIPACRTVGRPIFFSVMIILMSFIPVFALTGQEGKTFHPLAFTKSFAMLGVAILSITLVPALIPTFIRGRLRSEEESWLVRSLIAIYKPVLTWAMPRRNLVMWSFAVLLIVGAGLFPLDAVLGIAGTRPS